KQGRVYRGGGSDHEERVAVCGCLHDRFNADIAAAPWAILDDELLADALRQPLPHQARGDVVHGPRSKGDDDAYRPRRIGVRPGKAGDERQSDSTSDCDTQKLSACYALHLAHAVLLQAFGRQLSASFGRSLE